MSGTYTINVSTNLSEGYVSPVILKESVQMGDVRAHIIRVSLYKDGAEYNPENGATTIGYFQCKTGNPYSSTGTISGNVCTVKVPSNVYTASGEVVGVIRLTSTPESDNVNPVATIAKVAFYVAGDVSTSGAQTETSAWTVAQVESYVTQMRSYVDNFNSYKTTETAARTNADSTLQSSITYIKDALVLDYDTIENYNISDDGSFVSSASYHCYLFKVLPNRIIDSISLDDGSYLAYGFTSTKPTISDVLSYAFPNGKKRKFINAITVNDVVVPDGCYWLVVQTRKAEIASIDPQVFILSRSVE